MKKRPYKIIGLTLIIFIASISFIEMKFRQEVKTAAKPLGAVFSPNDKDVVLIGKELYFQNCGSCHGANLEGEPNWQTPLRDGLMPAPPHDENGHTWHHSDKMLFDIVKIGLGKLAGLDDYQTNMPIFEDILSDEEIIAIMSYIKSTWPIKIQISHDKLNASQAL